MPRKLPWLQNGSSTTATKQPPKAVTPARKRPKFVEDKPSSNGSDSGKAAEHEKPKSARTPSTSPPPEAPIERFMEEGVEKDDQYRMVEDELLTIAKQFTAHLHAAEYHRQKKAAGTKNADKINSISRPVTQKQPEQTKRKLESVDKSKMQRNALQGLLGNHGTTGAADDSESGDALPYVGTTLHGLMDSPRRRAASLTKFGSVAKATRAAAGFRRPTIHSQQSNNSRLSESPQSKIARNRNAKRNMSIGSSTESSEDDDDLDGPLRAPKFVPLTKSASTKNSYPPKPGQTVNDLGSGYKPVVTASSKGHARTQSSIKRLSSLPDARVDESDDHELPSHRRDADRLAAIRKRIERTRLQKADQQSKERNKKPLDVIPTFL
ncbi:hypothetical protein PVAG01_00779 [Phlyctema vagabunda]|uniref:Uncharacterized protein n=1 Tax=Phlyctema vagabunda TaxID=108571 RepID=A0ABR4PV77_9HELO